MAAGKKKAAKAAPRKAAGKTPATKAAPKTAPKKAAAAAAPKPTAVKERWSKTQILNELTARAAVSRKQASAMIEELGCISTIPPN